MANNRPSTISLRYAAFRAGRRCLGAYVSRGRRIWNHLPASLRRFSGHLYGRHLNALVRFQAERQQYFATFFLRNRAELELMRRLVEQRPPGSTINLSVLACSKGAEVYSVAWVLRTARPDLDFRIQAIDISQEIVDFAKRGIYSLTNRDTGAITNNEDVHRNTQRDQNAWIFERMTAEEMESLFEIQGDQAEVKPWIRQGISWWRGDAADPELPGILGAQDIVLAKNFLCHMRPRLAERCLRNIARTVKPGGYLFVSGVDLKVRTRVARDLRWTPVLDLIREIHEGDVSLRRGWPLEYWGLEPFRDTRADWRIRYASAFHIAETNEPMHLWKPVSTLSR